MINQDTSERHTVGYHTKRQWAALRHVLPTARDVDAKVRGGKRHCKAVKPAGRRRAMPGRELISINW